MKDIWKDWPEVKRLCKDKKVILWGRSDDWLPKIIPKLGFAKDVYIVDSNPAYDNTSFQDVPVYLPSVLDNEKKSDIYIIITGAVYDSISADLDKLGYKAGKDYCCNPEIKDWGLLQEIRQYDKNIIIACSDYKDNSKKRWSQMGGGIYTYNTRSNVLKKHIDGNFRQMIRVKNTYYAIEFVEKKVYQIDKSFRVVKKTDIDLTPNKEEKPNACGIAYYEDLGLFFIANAGSDIINIYNKKFQIQNRIHLSSKFMDYGDGQHHINDICVVDNYLLVSLFSISGNWKRGVMDGGIVAFDINKIRKGTMQFDTLATGLWMPHSIEYIDGNVCFLNSMEGQLYVGTKKVEGTFPGLVRGLAYDGRFYYIGLSEDMYTSRLFGIKDNIMCNAGVFLFDIKTKVSRFYSFPFIMNVHDILIEE